MDRIESFGNHPFIAFTNAQANKLDVNWLGVVNHGVDTETLCPRDDQIKSKALVIGKIYPAKRTHEAILASLKTGLTVGLPAQYLTINILMTMLDPC